MLVEVARGCKDGLVYGLSPDTDLTPLVDCMLTFVGISQYSLHLNFTGDAVCSISIEGDYVLETPDGLSTNFEDAVSGAAGLVRLLGRTVTAASIPSDGTVRLRFDDGAMVDVLESRAEHESYQVTIGPRLLIV